MSNCLDAGKPITGKLDECPSCGLKTTYRTEELLSTAMVRGKFFLFTGIKAYCEVCGMPVFLPQVEAENSRRMFVEYDLVSE